MTDWFWRISQNLKYKLTKDPNYSIERTAFYNRKRFKLHVSFNNHFFTGLEYILNWNSFLNRWHYRLSKNECIQNSHNHNKSSCHRISLLAVGERKLLIWGRNNIRVPIEFWDTLQLISLNIVHNHLDTAAHDK